MAWYLVLVGAVAGMRLAELRVARRNLAWALGRGGVEFGASHYPVMVAVHVALLIGCLVEAPFRPFVPALGWSALAVLAAAHGLRWWCVCTLGPQWNTRVIRVPGAPLVTDGPYRWLSHPNYVAVVVEGLVLPLVHSAWVTALGFTAVNALVLRHRLRVENRALATAPAS